MTGNKVGPIPKKLLPHYIGVIEEDELTFKWKIGRILVFLHINRTYPMLANNMTQIGNGSLGKMTFSHLLSEGWNGHKKLLLWSPFSHPSMNWVVNGLYEPHLYNTAFVNICAILLYPLMEGLAKIWEGQWIWDEKKDIVTQEQEKHRRRAIQKDVNLV
ncbi:hypothetical protein ACJX0J_020474 [Zea mays]